jgi:hypothetical protein
VTGSQQKGRSLWVFGDGVFWRPGYTQPQNAAPTSDVKGLAGNTIAIHSWSASQNAWDTPLAGNLDFGDGSIAVLDQVDDDVEDPPLDSNGVPPRLSSKLDSSSKKSEN